jgi:hypothetical protein
MKPLARAAVLTTMRDALAVRGSWTGETHLQKALFILQEGARVPLAYNFILYKHGPFAFDLREEINDLRADGILDLEPQGYPYGPRLRTTPVGKRLQERFPKTLHRYGKQIEAVADLVRDRGVVELERLGTALLMMNDQPGASDTDVGKLVADVKPHVSEELAEASAAEMRRFLEVVSKYRLKESELGA